MWSLISFFWALSPFRWALIPVIFWALNPEPIYHVMTLPRQSWFEIHYNDHRIPDGFFKQQLRVRRATFNQLLNNVSPHVARQDTSMRNCIPAEKILAKNCEIRFLPVFQIWLTLRPKKNKKIVILRPLDKIWPASRQDIGFFDL